MIVTELVRRLVEAETGFICDWCHERHDAFGPIITLSADASYAAGDFILRLHICRDCWRAKLRSHILAGMGGRWPANSFINDDHDDEGAPLDDDPALVRRQPTATSGVDVGEDGAGGEGAAGDR